MLGQGGEARKGGNRNDGSGKKLASCEARQQTQALQLMQH